MFDTTLRLLKEYLGPLREQPPPGFDLIPATELQKRIRQLNFILVRVRELEDESEQFFTSGVPHGPGVRERILDVSFEQELFTEAFYYFAFRARQLIVKEKFPGLKTFKCDGVRDARNHLLEHSKIALQSFGSGHGGPTLKPARYERQTIKHHDQGLFVNAEEFRRNLDILLTMEIARRSGAA